MQVLLIQNLQVFHPQDLSATAGPLGIMMQCEVIGISVGKQLLFPELSLKLCRRLISWQKRTHEAVHITQINTSSNEQTPILCRQISVTTFSGSDLVCLFSLSLSFSLYFHGVKTFSFHLSVYDNPSSEGIIVVAYPEHMH